MNIGVTKVFDLIQTIISVIRWIVPIGLIVMTAFELFTKVLNPESKDTGRKIMNRIIAGVIVFFTPLLVNVVLNIIDIGSGKTIGSTNSASACWR